VQAEQRGTGHAARCALPALEGVEGEVVILYGDVPLIEPEAIRALADARGDGALALLTCRVPEPSGYGRILRDEAGAVTGIREHRDASEAERAIDEINPGLYAAEVGFLRDALAGLSDDNAQGELYLTDIVEAAAKGSGARSVEWPLDSLMGVNDRAQLAEANAAMRRRIAVAHARAGVTIRDLDRVDIDADVELAADAVIEPNVTLRGATSVAAGARIDVGCVLTDVRVAPGAYLKPYSVATESAIGEDAQVGPFSHLRPGSELGPESRVGNFVETKKTRIGRGSKANHLAYLGDGILGEGVNVGAGTIFCNYDGFQKHTTVLEDGAFIGSDSQLVAPITVGEGAYVATGTTVTKNVPADALAVGRIRQENKEGYASRLKARLKSRASKG
jgi:bifunctional UDP-N-acetylglucosamine pyrophosphorylase/glucosamine-1-phosphate N-acetyltransferase